MENLDTFIQMQNQLFAMLEPLLRSYGIKLYVDRIVLYPKDCREKCIEYVWRIECEMPEVCEELRKKIVEQSGGTGEQGGEKG